MPKVYLKNYEEYPFDLANVFLDFDLYDDHAVVINRMHFDRKTAGELILFGQDLNLVNISLNNEPLNIINYEITPEALIIKECPEQFVLEVTTLLKPQENSSLQGLYVTDDIFCTHCEAEGFRRISYFPDRPDVLSIFTTKITADVKNSVLLSNGNLIDSGINEEGRSWVLYEDPYKKPSYLFALVAGDLNCISSTFVTKTWKTVSLNIYAKKATEENCEYALTILKDAMRFDEEEYGREYDLNTYNIVGVSDFNIGAMENKGLNIFNAKFILGDPKITTDKIYEKIATTVSHEYFHNWTGNRITLRDWFQLSIKEGLTVFREHQFSSFFNSSDVCRIERVDFLRRNQFLEDSSALAHPVRPEVYEQIDNFYTSTVYRKGAEVAHMLHTILGRDGFRQGMDVYFSLYDGKAITVEDFIHAMEVANNKDLTQFMLWYTQPGTPEVTVTSEYHNHSLTLNFTQDMLLSVKSKQNLPFHIPIKMQFFYKDGTTSHINKLIELKDKQQSFHFINLPSKPVVSLLRDFSAPIILRQELDNSENLDLLIFETDGFAKWEASKRLALSCIVELYESSQKIANATWSISSEISDAYRHILLNYSLDYALRFEILSPPSFEDVIRELQLRGFNIIDIELVGQVRDYYEEELGFALLNDFKNIYLQLVDAEDHSINNVAFSRRKLKNFCLQMLVKCCPDDYTIGHCFSQYDNDHTMTDQLASFLLLSVCHNDTIRNQVIDDFYNRWKDDDNLIDYWFSCQALSHRSDAINGIWALIEHPAFNIQNPNRVYALLRTFAFDNPGIFHSKDGSGYELLGHMILKIDKINPVVASKLARAFTKDTFLDAHRIQLISQEIERMMTITTSSNLAEILVLTQSSLRIEESKEEVIKLSSEISQEEKNEVIRVSKTNNFFSSVQSLEVTEEQTQAPVVNSSKCCALM